MNARMAARISFTVMNAEHLYEYLCMYWLVEGKGKFGGCFECEDIGRRLEKFIGPKAVRRIKRSIKAHPGKHNEALRKIAVLCKEREGEHLIEPIQAVLDEL